MSAGTDRLNDEIQATFIERKENLIACLRKSWGRGPRERPFDPERAWWLLKVIVAAMTTPSRTPPREMREHALELAEALGKVRKILARTIKERPELANEITWAWTSIATGGASAVSILSGQTPTDGLGEQLQQAVVGVFALEAAAKLVGEWNHKPRGNQYGSGQLPIHYVLLLSYVYAGITGVQPTTTETGLFMDFMRAVRNTFNLPLGDDAVHRAVKLALRCARRKPSDRLLDITG
jgi:hypothetical protein